MPHRLTLQVYDPLSGTRKTFWAPPERSPETVSQEGGGLTAPRCVQTQPQSTPPDRDKESEVRPGGIVSWS